MLFHISLVKRPRKATIRPKFIHTDIHYSVIKKMEKNFGINVWQLMWVGDVAKWLKWILTEYK